MESAVGSWFEGVRALRDRAGGRRRQGVKTIPYFCAYAEASSSIAPRSVSGMLRQRAQAQIPQNNPSDAQQVLDGPAVAGQAGPDGLLIAGANDQQDFRSA